MLHPRGEPVDSFLGGGQPASPGNHRDAAVTNVDEVPGHPLDRVFVFRTDEVDTGQAPVDADQRDTAGRRGFQGVIRVRERGQDPPGRPVPVRPKAAMAVELALLVHIASLPLPMSLAPHLVSDWNRIRAVEVPLTEDVTFSRYVPAATWTVVDGLAARAARPIVRNG